MSRSGDDFEYGVSKCAHCRYYRINKSGHERCMHPDNMFNKRGLTYFKNHPTKINIFRRCHLFINNGEIK